MTTLPISMPYVFANATTTQRLAYLDADFATLTNAVNGIGNGSVALSNVNITGGNVSPAANSIPVSAIQASGNLTNATFLNGAGIWTAVPSSAGGTVIYVDVNGGTTGLTTSGGPVSYSGNITLSGTLYSNSGGTGLNTVGMTGNVLTSDGSSWVSQRITIPQNAQTSSYVLVYSDNGKHISITTGGVTVPSSVFNIGDTVSIYNNSSSNQTITQGSGVTMYLVGMASTGNRTLAQRGLCTILCVDTNTFVITGGGLT